MMCLAADVLRSVTQRILNRATMRESSTLRRWDGARHIDVEMLRRRSSNMTTEMKESEFTDTPSAKARELESLLLVASDARVFRSDDGRVHARVAVGGRQEVVELRSARFREWLVDVHLHEFRQLPSGWAVRRVLEALEARARLNADRQPVFVRIGRDLDDAGSCYYLDLADPEGRAVKIGAAGWSIVDRPSVPFQRPLGLLPLPVPSAEGSIELLRGFVNLSEPDFRLLIVWMAAALQPSGPYPILAIHGEQGSAKSTLARIVRHLLDPQAAPLLAEPGSTRDLMITALNGWLLALDNVSVLTSSLSDSLCRLASGGGFSTRALYSNADRHVIYAQRPVILNGIDEFVRRGDLADRGVFLHLPPIPPEGRREEHELWGSFRQLQPQLLGGLLDAVVGALRELPSVHLAKLPRMADFARFGEALGRGMGWPPETFLDAYLENRRDTSGSTLADSALGDHLLLCASIGGLLDWTRSPTDMLDELTRDVPRRIASSSRWPQTPSMLGNELRRLAPQLREHGIFVIFKRTKESRLITITRRMPQDQAG
jgi:hypothetical protein